MAIPRLQRAFGVFGDLRMANLAIFVTVLLISTYFTNKYIGMNITSRVIERNPRNLSRKIVDERRQTYISTSEKGSFAIGAVGSIYFVLSIYGLIGIIAREIHLLLAPMILLPTTAFIMFVLIFFDLGIQETSGFLFFWVFTGIVIKAIMIATSLYSFLIVFSYYMEVTVGPQVESPAMTGTISPDWLPNIPEPLAFSEAAKFPSKSSPEKTPIHSLSPAQKSPKTPPPRPPPPRPKSPLK